MTNWQIFALSSPAIIAAVMWLQGLAEGHFEFSGSSQKTSTTLDDSVSSHVEIAAKGAVSGYFVPVDVLATRGATQEIRRILAETFRLEAVKIETGPKTETPSTPTESAGSASPSKRVF